MTIRVGLSCTMLEPALTGGRVDGIGVYTSALQQGLPEFDCQVQAWAYAPLRRGHLAQQFTLSRALDNSFEWATVRDYLAPKAVVSRVPADIFHATDYRIVRMNCPVVATLHDAVPIKYPQWCNPKARGLKNWLQKKAAKKADHVIALSHYAVAELVECFGVDEKRITVIHCGVDNEWLQTPGAHEVQATLTKYQLRAGYFLFVGTLQPRKNVERIVQAYLSLPASTRAERQLVIVGGAGAQSEDALRQIKAAQENGAAVFWLSEVKARQELRQLYEAAGVFVFPSLYEGFGIPVAEAFAAQIPVVTSNSTSLPEVSQGAALEVDPLDVAAIADAMQQLASDDALRARCVAAGKARLPELSWQNTAEQTAALYRAALGR